MYITRLLLLIICFNIVAPLQAMDGSDSKSLFGKTMDLAREHPFVVGSIAFIGGAIIGGSVLGYTLDKCTVYLRRSMAPLNLLKGAEEGDLKKIQKALKYGADINLGLLQYSEDMDTALGVASRAGHKKIVEWLLAHGAKRNVMVADHNLRELELEASTSGGALGQAIDNDNVEQMQLLLTTCSKNYQEPFTKQYSCRKVTTILCVFMHGYKRTKMPFVPKDIRLRILSYVPETVFSQKYCKLLIDHGANLAFLINKCPFDWFKNIYSQSDEDAKPKLLAKLVPLLLAKHKDEVAVELQDIGKYISSVKVQVAKDFMDQEATLELIECNIRESLSGALL